MDKEVRANLPRIGKRIIKSAMSVFLCFVFYFVFRKDGVTLNSQFAALCCIQPHRENMISSALQRTVGTLTGALFGMIVVLFDKHWLSRIVRDERELLYALVVSVAIVGVIYFNLLIKKRDASSISCVVFLSIVVSHVGDADPYIAVLNRIIDTMIGIMIGMFVNSIHLPRRKERDILFISGMDNTLLGADEELSAYSVIELNRMLRDGVNFTVSTRRTPASLLEPLRDIDLKLPVIAMDGAVIYDTKTNEYLHAYVISLETARKLQEFLDRFSVNYFVNMIVEHMLIIQYKELENEAEKDIYEKLHMSPYRNYTTRDLLEESQCIYFMIVARWGLIHEIYKALKETEFYDRLRIVMYDSDDYPGFMYIKIYNKNAVRENMIEYLKKMTGLEKTVTFGSAWDRYDVVIDQYDNNKVVRTLEKMYEPLRWAPKL